MALVVDAMGGDDAPRSPVRGALQAAADVSGPIELVGLPTAIEPLLQGAASGERIRVVAATEQIGMDEHPVEAVRKKRDASLVVAARRVKELGAEGALVSAGSTGAVLAASLLHIGRIPGVERPAIAVVLPLFTGPVVLLDGGANVDCRPSHLVQFGVLGRVFARVVLGIPEARVGLLNIGEEETKGNELTIAVHPLMRRHVPGFVGNVEGKDVFAGTCDVVVCDGFVGNVLLKSIEGFAAALLGEIKRAAAASVRGKLGGWLLKGALSSLRARLDYRSYGGAFLIGVRGVVVVAHGRSDEVAMANAVRLAHRGVRGDLVASIGEAIQRLPEEVSSHAGS